MLKNPVISPAQPKRAKTRLVPGKAAASEEAKGVRFGTLSPLSDARTTLASFFSILLVFDFRFGKVAYHH